MTNNRVDDAIVEARNGEIDDLNFLGSGMHGSVTLGKEDKSCITVLSTCWKCAMLC